MSEQRYMNGRGNLLVLIMRHLFFFFFWHSAFGITCRTEHIGLKHKKELLFRYSRVAFLCLCPPLSMLPPFSSHYPFFFLSSSFLCSPPWFQVAMVTQLFPRPATRITIRLAGLSNTHTHTHTHIVARSEWAWQCQRPDESNDRLTSVYRPQLTSPWAAHKQLISLRPLSFSFFFLVLCLCSFFHLFFSLPCRYFFFLLESGVIGSVQ